MKKFKLIGAVIVVLVVSNLVLAVSPLSGNTNNFATLMVEKLDKDVQLTDSQKNVIKKKANTFITTMQNANSKTTEKEKFNFKKQASDEYEALLDSLLTSDQKERRNIKIQQRENAAK